MCGFCETAVQYVKIALHNNETISQIEHAVDQLCDSAFAGLDAGPAEVCVRVCMCVCTCIARKIAKTLQLDQLIPASSGLGSTSKRSEQL